MDEKYVHFSRLTKPIKKVKFQSKGFENNMMYLGRFRRINKVEKCVEVIDLLSVSNHVHVTHKSTNTCLLLIEDRKVNSGDSLLTDNSLIFIII